MRRHWRDSAQPRAPQDKNAHACALPRDTQLKCHFSFPNLSPERACERACMRARAREHLRAHTRVCVESCGRLRVCLRLLHRAGGNCARTASGVCGLTAAPLPQERRPARPPPPPPGPAPYRGPVRPVPCAPCSCSDSGDTFLIKTLPFGLPCVAVLNKTKLILWQQPGFSGGPVLRYFKKN